MSANIEINNGVASYAENGRKERAWHRLGQVFDRPMTVVEALEASHADFEVTLNNVAVITPAIAEAMAQGDVPADLILEALIEGKKATMRTDKNKALGVVGEGYGIVQNRDAFTFIDTLCTGQAGNDHVPVIESAGVLGRGERIFITAKFPDDIILDNKGDDRVEMYMVFTTSHDGMGAVKCMVTPTRVVCNNTLTLAMVNNRGCLSLRHSSNIMQRLDLTSKENTEFAFKALNLMDVYTKSLKERFDHLRNIKIAEHDLDNILAQVAMSEKDAELFRLAGVEAEGIATVGKKKFYAMKEAVESGIGQDLGERGTGLWLVNGITTYYQNNADWRNDEVKFDSILHGYTAQKVMDACMAVENI